MKAAISLLALAASAVALNVPRGHPHGGKETTTLTTYETVTTCPVTTTKTSNGSTYEVTQLTTSTITITTCYGCGGGPATVTVPGPTSVVGTTTEVDVTYTTVCPVTETVTGAGKTYTTEYTTTSVVYTKVLTTLYETVPGPAVTQTEGTVEYSTITSLCPVTETKTEGGSTIYVTWTSTSLITVVVPTTVDVTQVGPPVTETEGAVETYTTTSLCPVTETKTVAGSTIHVTWTSTQVITTVKPVTIDVTVGSGATVTEYPTVVVTENGTVVQTHTAPPGTVVAPTTVSATPVPSVVTSASSSAPVQVTNAANPNKAPAAALLAGIFGVLALV